MATPHRQETRFFLRPAVPDDSPALARLEESVFDPQHYPLMNNRSFRHLLTKGNCEIPVAQSGERIIGMVVMLFRANSSVGRLYSICVHRDFQGQDVGKALYEEGERQARERGCRSLVLEIRDDNHRHLKRYLGLGFHQSGRLDDYYPDHHEAIKLEKIL